MSLVLKRVRACNSSCCKESPRWPTPNGKSCVYLDTHGCRIQRYLEDIPKEKSPAQPNITAKEAFQKTCLDWPHNSEPRIGKTGNCCWQWVDE